MTPKRTCIAISPSSATTSDNRYPACDKNKTIMAEDSPLTLNSSDRITPSESSQNATSETLLNLQAAESLEVLRRRRNELKQSITTKEQTLHNLKLVKLHRTKVRFLMCASNSANSVHKTSL